MKRAVLPVVAIVTGLVAFAVLPLSAAQASGLEDVCYMTAGPASSTYPGGYGPPTGSQTVTCYGLNGATGVEALFSDGVHNIRFQATPAVAFTSDAETFNYSGGSGSGPDSSVLAASWIPDGVTTYGSAGRVTVVLGGVHYYADSATFGPDTNAPNIPFNAAPVATSLAGTVAALGGGVVALVFGAAVGLLVLFWAVRFVRMRFRSA